MKSRPVYLDYSATTPVDPVVAEKMMEHLTLDGIFANPASRSHMYGWQAEQAVEKARRQVADVLGADPREIVWTSGATESDNLAIKGAAFRHQDKGRHIVTSAIEHKAVLDACRYLEKQGFEVTYLMPGEDGLVTAGQVEAALRDETILVSVMHANNELGTINDIEAIGEVLKEHQALFHIDAAQTVGKLPFDLASSHVDLLSCCAHKIYGPKGIGALYVRREPFVGISAQIHGGGHERGMRSGTLPTHQIVGMGEALQIAEENRVAEQEMLLTLREQLMAELKGVCGIEINGHPEQRLAGVLNLQFGYVNGETLLMAMKDIAVSSGSACTSASVEPSFVLKAIGLSDDAALSSVRLSLGRFTTKEDIERAGRCIRESLEKLRAVSPAWKAYREQVL